MIKPVLPLAIRALVVLVINDTPDGPVGYAEAMDGVSGIWQQFDAAGAVVGDLEAIGAYIRWAKCEGFCSTSPMEVKP